MEKITEIKDSGRTFYILQDHNGFWGIEDKFFQHGRLTQSFNGLTGNLSDRIEDTIQKVCLIIRRDYYLSMGFDILTAAMWAIEDVKA